MLVHTHTMRVVFVAILCAAAWCFDLPAAQIKLDTLTVGSQTYRDVTILGVNTTDVYFKHSTGFANAKIRQLDKDSQKRLNFNPQAAAEAEKQQAAADSKYQEALLSTISSQPGKGAPEASVDGAYNPFGDPITEKSLIGKQAPDFSGFGWKPKLPDMKGKHVLICFWAPWSTAARQALPGLKAMQGKYADRVVLLGVFSGAPTGSQPDQAETGFPVTTDSDSKLAGIMEVTCVPTVLLIDPQGVVLYRGHPAALDETKLSKVLGK